jgi:hypothetical protein
MFYSLLFFFFFSALPLFFTADELVYCKSAYDSSFDNNSSFSSGVRVCILICQSLLIKLF